MIRQGYARLLVALVAAIGLHALFLIHSGDPTLTISAVPGGEPLQVALSPHAQREYPAAAQTAKQASERESRTNDQPTAEPVKSQRDAEAGNAVVEALPDVAAMAQVPVAVQATILAKIGYPRQARRRGLEGQAEFRFDVNRQAVQQVSMLVSSGHPILDQAARRGLLSVGSLPLHDGSYQLPVIFRLQ